MANQPVINTAMRAPHPLVAPTSVPTIRDVHLTQLVDKGNFKGSVYELGLFRFKPHDIAVLYRAAGLSTPGHFHTGTDLSFAPQVMYCLAGRLTVHCRDLQGNQQHFNLVTGTMMVIPAFIWHAYSIAQDAIIAEVRQQPFDPAQSDTYDETSFEEIIL